MTSLPPRTLPSLPEQFLPVPGWKDGAFTHDGRFLAYGYILPSGPMRACAVVLPGRAEFREKYFEIMRDMLARDIGVFIMDWFGQGSSLRYLSDPHKDHSLGFEHHVADFNAFIRDIVTPILQSEGRAETPLIMLAHSMGAHLGLRYLMTSQQSFAGAVLVSPMLGIHNITDKPMVLLRLITTILTPLHGFYAPAPWHGAWREDGCKAPGEDILSSDKIRDTVQRAWFSVNIHLQLGAPTWGWVHHALQSCDLIEKSTRLSPINVPVLFMTAGNDRVVDNTATRRIAARIPGAQHTEIPGAHHEIMMEQDAYRNLFLEYFDNFTKDVKIGSKG